MCLTKVTKSLTPSTAIQDGWKEFGYATDGSLEFQNFPVDRTKRKVVFDTWMKAESIQVQDDNGKKYLADFHVYKDEEDIRTSGSRYRRVYIRGTHTEGLQSTTPCLVAAEIYVPSNSDGWPPSSTKTTLSDKLKKAIGKKPGTA